MMPHIEKLEDVYSACKVEGKIQKRIDVDEELVKSLHLSAKDGFERIRSYDNKFEKKTNNYSFILRDHYEVLRMLLDAFCLLDKIHIDNHQCSNAYISTAHPELELDWANLETMRILKNAVNYQGARIPLEQWDKIRIHFKAYIEGLLKDLSQRIKGM